jgi:hypothetical protein
MAAIVATLATVCGIGAMVKANNFTDLILGLLILGVGIYLLGYSPWL